MCLIKTHRFPKISKKDITVYKAVYKEGNNYYTPYRHYNVQLNKIYCSNKNALLGIFDTTIGGCGIHSFKYSGYAVDLALRLTASTTNTHHVVECVIPKGSLYYLGNAGDIASSKLIYKKFYPKSQFKNGYLKT